MNDHPLPWVGFKKRSRATLFESMTQSPTLATANHRVYDDHRMPSSGSEIQIAEHVERALVDGEPVVALESTVIAHGLPYPTNIETALACEAAIRESGATPATIAIVEGVSTIGLIEEQIEALANAQNRGGVSIEKVGLNNLAGVIHKKGWGATTVASTLKLAHAAGIRVFSTGGIGGVHRGASDSFDISADLTALGDTPLVCVCAGAKAILDLPNTLEYLETLGVPVVGYGANEFPAFYSRGSGLPVNVSVESADDAANLVSRHWGVGSSTAVLVCVPVPADFEIAPSEIAEAVEEANARAARQGVRGNAVTPFLLGELEKLTSGRTVETNCALLKNNARVAASIAVSLAKCALARVRSRR